LRAQIVFMPLAGPHLAEDACTTGCTGVSAMQTAEAMTSAASQVTVQPPALQSEAPSVTIRRPAIAPGGP
jgi:hypothetical protein